LSTNIFEVTNFDSSEAAERANSGAAMWAVPKHKVFPAA
jgi:hypothetical protein